MNLSSRDHLTLFILNAHNNIFVPFLKNLYQEFQLSNSNFLLPETQIECLNTHFLLVAKSPFLCTPLHILLDYFPYIIISQQMMCFCLIRFQKFTWSTVQVLYLKTKVQILIRLLVTLVSGSRKVSHVHVYFLKFNCKWNCD